MAFYSKNVLNKMLKTYISFKGRTVSRQFCFQPFTQQLKLFTSDKREISNTTQDTLVLRPKTRHNPYQWEHTGNKKLQSITEMLSAIEALLSPSFVPHQNLCSWFPETYAHQYEEGRPWFSSQSGKYSTFLAYIFTNPCSKADKWFLGEFCAQLNFPTNHWSEFFI